MKKIITSDNFSVSATLECGQVFRYDKLSDTEYVVRSTDKRCFLRQLAPDKVELDSDDIEYFTDYFDLNTDYGEITNSLSRFDELKEAVSIGKGIRILRQDFYETVMSFIVSANNNIKRIRGIIERLCVKCGENKGDYYAFPTAKSLQSLTIDDFSALGLGYRAPYMYHTCRVIDDLAAKIHTLTPTERDKELLRLKGVGSKVKDCITLFSLHDASAYPVDTWIFKSCRTDELDTVDKVRKFYSERYAPYAGYAQQYIFYAARQKENEASKIQ
jgi:N-glycosylase/DNA lyase